MIDKKLLINLFGGPSCGKTTAAADLFTSLKRNHIDCALVSEFATELILEGNDKSLQDQFYVSGNQYHRIKTAYESFAVTIVDSPLLLGIVYQQGLPAAFNELLMALHQSFHSLNVLLKRNMGYSHTLTGRLHGITESMGLDREIQTMLETHEVRYFTQDRSQEELTQFLTGQITEFLKGD